VLPQGGGEGQESFSGSKGRKDRYSLENRQKRNEKASSTRQGTAKEGKIGLDNVARGGITSFPHDLLGWGGEK